ncbi:MAG: hypothetical protein U1G07_19805 [Verrucomicrobiota bacterium]
MIPLISLALLLSALFGAVPAYPQPVGVAEVVDDDVSALKMRVDRLESQVGDHAAKGATAVLFGAFCALWAQNTRRNAWLWFFIGALFTVITIFVLLYKNSEDRQGRRSPRG